MQLKHVIAIALVVCVAIGSFIGGRVYQVKTTPELLGGPGINGFFGVYNSTTPTYYDGQSAAVALDSRGRLDISPSTTITIIGP